MKIVIRKSSNRKKKFVADVGGRKIRFGDPKYDDYTTHNDEGRKRNYISRHRKNEDWGDMRSPGFWSKNMLWNRPTLRQSVDDLNKRYRNVSFVLK